MPYEIPYSYSVEVFPFILFTFSILRIWYSAKVIEILNAFRRIKTYGIYLLPFCVESMHQFNNHVYNLRPVS